MRVEDFFKNFFLGNKLINYSLLDIGYVSNETNTDVRMYICRIYSSRDLDTLLHKVELDMHWKNAGLYTLTTKD